MDDFCENELSKYVTLTQLNITHKSKVYLVKNTLDNKIYIKKHVENYNLNVYKMLKSIESYNIPRIYDLFEIDNELIIIEEFINGLTLEEIKEKSYLIDEKKVALYMITLCGALEKLHNLNPPIIHRDIKPSNIIINNDGILKLIDFDVSKIFKEYSKKDTALLGTKGYISPELYCFNRTDIRSDIYSIGILINVLTIGAYPQDIENPGILNPIIKKCTNLSPENRYQTVSELKKDLENIFEEVDESKKSLSLEKNKKEMFKKPIINYDLTEDNKALASTNASPIKLSEIYKIIPGFRTETPWKTIIAILWYMFVISGLFIKPLLSIMFLLFTSLYTNFLNLKEKLPLIKNENISVKIFGYFFYSFIIFFGLGAFLK
ncbi:Serine/threonine protein kinase [Clostridium cavendishii DSM 21758]|uniref:non-specific serine/threonine protein kinase n=1 Tax=Clostridium cavendishii DSM 21758 TaxID=1121302 RepID=A0A1M6IWI4_9CLOT|nr:serine/threonine-protein kinase [Clostridium cavendishii]SHJ38782.1 Serine/threonine protein kinase [Clostridium cavendishii DSM 21758]